MRRVIANAHFTGKTITIDFAREALRDLLALQDRLVTIDNIQKTVAEYFKIRVGRPALQAPESIDHPAAADRDVAGQGADQSQPAGDR